VAFLSASGQDSEWEMIKRLSTPFMNLDHVQQFENASTGSYFSAIFLATPPIERVDVTGFDVSATKSLCT
jgi:hypothetical protein